MGVSNLIEKGALAGLGLISASKEKAEKMVDDLVKKGEVSKAEGKKIVSSLKSKAKKVETEIDKKVNKAVLTVVNKLGFVRKKDFDALVRKVASLEKKLK